MHFCNRAYQFLINNVNLCLIKVNYVELNRNRCCLIDILFKYKVAVLIKYLQL